MTQTPWTAPDVERTDPPYVADERTMLQTWLDFHRDTLLMKCAGLGAEQLATASAPPSNLTLLGLVRHMSEVERSWFRQRMTAQDVSDIYCTEEQPDADFENVADADAAADLATFREECTKADEAVASVSLDATFQARNTISLRWIYVHMIEEYARHNGHADLIRERIDGATGD